MKVIQVNVNATSGSTGKIVTDIKAALEAQGHECIVAYGANETVKVPGYERICSEPERKFNAAISRLTGINHGDFGFLSTPKLIRLIKKENPDIVHLQCPNGYIVDLFRILKFLGKNGIKTVVTNHAEYFYTGTCGHALECDHWLTGCGNCPIFRHETCSYFDRTSYSWRQMKESFETFDHDNLIITSVSPWLQSRAVCSPLMSRFRHEVVINGLETSIFCPVNVSDEVRLKFNPAKKLVLFVSASFDDSPNNFKGGDKFIHLARLMPEIQFCVAATHIKIEGALPPNVVLWGRAKSQQELAELYSLADCTVIASKRETFSMVTAESLCCGTPVVGFKAGGPESIAIPEYSDFVEYGDINALQNTVVEILNAYFNRQAISKQAAAIYSKEVMGQNYLRIYSKLLN